MAITDPIPGAGQEPQYAKFPFSRTICRPECVSGDYSSGQKPGDVDIPKIENPIIPKPEELPKITDGKTSCTGSGVFDEMMKAVKAHLDCEWEAGRIDGPAYTSAYVQMLPQMMQAAVSYVAQQAQAALALQQSLELQAEGPANRMLKYAQVEELKEKIRFLQLQINETYATGTTERELKAAQKIVQEQQAALYERQARGFDDKARMDALKIVMDAWAVQNTEVDENAQPLKDLQEFSLRSKILKALEHVGL